MTYYGVTEIVDSEWDLTPRTEELGPWGGPAEGASEAASVTATVASGFPADALCVRVRVPSMGVVEEPQELWLTLSRVRGLCAWGFSPLPRSVHAVEDAGTVGAGASGGGPEERGDTARPWADVRRTLPKATLAHIDQQMAALQERFARLTLDDLANDPLSKLAGTLRDGAMRDARDIDRYLYGDE